MQFIDPKLEDYCKEKSSPPANYLHELERETHLKTLAPVMVSGHLQGRVLSMISKLVRPELALEIGTFTGYSALCLAEGLAENGKLHTIEVNDELQPLIEKYLQQSPYHSKIELHLGPAEDIIPEIEGEFDLVFIDAGKKMYAQFFDLVADRMRAGGLILADNVLWSGKVLIEKTDDETQALKEFNSKVLEHPEFEVLMLPIRDGISVIRKK
ncbi:MAG: O-methyltransferase [Saprospirales bacterium]|nr:MAG: O-methyltransferase [Saprospirales bacterium]